MNLQNWPSHDDRAQRLKSCIAPKLDAFIFADFQAFEVRVAAYYLAAQPSLRDFALVDEFKRGDDPHFVTGRLIYGRDPTKAERDKSKRVMLSLLYSGTWRTILRQGIVKTAREAQDFVEEFHRARPQIGMLNACVKRIMEDRGYVRTLWGRQLSGDPEVPLWKRPMTNYLVQGSASDLIKDAMLNVSDFLNRGLYDSHLVLSIHDEIGLDCTEVEIPTIIENLPRLMSNERVAEYLPLGVDIEVARGSWANSRPWEPEPEKYGSLPWEEE